MGNKYWHQVLVFSFYLLVFCFASCNPETRCDTPMGDATCQLDLMQYDNLSNVGGYEYLVGGYQGIVVIRLGLEQYVAYERTCPHDHGRLSVSKDYAGSVLECPKCHSCFIADLDGIPLDGSQTSCPLYQYSTHYSAGTLYISNW